MSKNQTTAQTSTSSLTQSVVFKTTHDRVAQAIHDAKAPISALKIALKSRQSKMGPLTTSTRNDQDDLTLLSQQAMARLESILADLKLGYSTDNMSLRQQNTQLPASLPKPLTNLDFENTKPTIAEVIAKIVFEKKSLLNFDTKREVIITQKLDQASHEVRA